MFSMKYKMSIPEMRKETFYNNVRKAGYAECPDYLAGLEIESCDYRDLFERFKDTPGVVFLVDPPYLSTDVGTYRMYWRLADYLDVLSVLSGHNFVYFTSENRASWSCASGWAATRRSATPSSGAVAGNLTRP